MLKRQFFEKRKLFWRRRKFNDLNFSTNITNKSFIVRYVLFNIDVDVEIDIDENDILSKKFRTNLDKRESFDDANFDVICAQNICFFDVTNDVANNVNSLKLNVASKIKIVDEIKSVWIVASLFANKINSLENDVNTSFTSFVANFWWWSCTCWCNLMLLRNLTKQRLQTKTFARFFAIRALFCFWRACSSTCCRFLTKRAFRYFFSTRAFSTIRACCFFVKRVSFSTCYCILVCLTKKQ